MGRTGLRNRGSLHQWGPNFSVDTIITRWKKSARGETKTLQLLAERRPDFRYGIPGGYDRGELHGHLWQQLPAHACPPTVPEDQLGLELINDELSNALAARAAVVGAEAARAAEATDAAAVEEEAQPHLLSQCRSPALDHAALFRLPVDALQSIVVDHVVQGRVLFPGTGSLELTRAAAMRAATSAAAASSGPAQKVPSVTSPSNAGLAQADLSIEFTPEEWQSFKVTNLQTHHFVKAGGAYYRPASELSFSKISWKVELAYRHALNVFDWPEDRSEFERLWREMLERGAANRPVFEGYSDDPRNTDHAWWESRVSHFHMENDLSELWPEIPSRTLKDGNGAFINLLWLDMDRISEPRFADLYASHKVWVNEVQRMLEPHIKARRRLAGFTWDIRLEEDDDTALVRDEDVSWGVPFEAYAPQYLPPAYRRGTPRQPRTYEDAHECASGLKWRDNGNRRPLGAIELINPALAEALSTKCDFSKSEWNAFKVGVDQMCVDRFVQVGKHYFTPLDRAGPTNAALRLFTKTTAATLRAHGSYEVPNYGCVADLRADWLRDETNPMRAPKNPAGRTGKCGLGDLPRWGPNHAIDIILTRRHPKTGRLQLAVTISPVSSPPLAGSTRRHAHARLHPPCPCP